MQYQAIQTEIIRILTIKGTAQLGAAPRGGGARRIIELLQNEQIPPSPKGKGKGKGTDQDSMDITDNGENMEQKDRS